MDVVLTRQRRAACCGSRTRIGLRTSTASSQSLADVSQRLGLGPVWECRRVVRAATEGRPDDITLEGSADRRMLLDEPPFDLVGTRRFE